MILRRHFIKNAPVFLASVSSSPLTAGTAIIAPDSAAAEQQRRTRIVEALAHYCAANGIDGPDEDCVDAFMRACSAIRPANHLEYTIALACSDSKNGQELCDEYSRRKNGWQPSELFSHDVLTGPNALAPDTFGLIFFKEQLERFLGGLVAEEGELRLDAGMAMRKRMGAQSLAFVDFYECLHPRFEARLSAQQAYDLYNYLSEYFWCHSYMICSAIVTRAGL